MNDDKTIFDFSATTASGEKQPLSIFQGKVTLIVNVASKCGFTPQYDGLEALQVKYKDRGFSVIGFPCNQFGAQESGSNQEIQEFCRLNHGVTFPVMAKIDVNGDKADPIYNFLKEAAPGILGIEAIKWNFTKFLVGKDGKVIERFAPQTTPEAMTKAIEKALG